MNYFPVIYSSLDPKELLYLVSYKYHLESHSKITYLKRGMNDTYLISEETKKNKYILRVYSHHWRTLKGIKNEIDFISSMYHQHYLNVSYPVAPFSNKYYHPINANEGMRYAVLFTFAEGKQVRKLSNEQAHLLGVEIGKLHSFSINNEPLEFDHNYDIDYQFDGTLKTLKPILLNHPEQYKYLISLQKDFTKTFAKADKNELAYGICHGDLQAENIHFTNENKITIFDFDFMGYGYLAYDIGVFIWYDHKNKTPEIIKSFIEGYETQRKLTATEKQLLPYFSTLRAIFQMTLYCKTNDGQRLPIWQPDQVADFVKKVKSWHEKGIINCK